MYAHDMVVSTSYLKCDFEQGNVGCCDGVRCLGDEKESGRGVSFVSISRYIARQFGKPVGVGGAFVSCVMNRQNRPLYRDVIRLLSPSDSDSVLDLGCGNGYLLNMLASRSACALAGVDFSPGAIKNAMSKNRKLVSNGRMNFVCRDMRELPFPDFAFDKAVSINTVYFWKDLDGIMAEVRRVLKLGGLFVNALFTNDTLDRFSHTKYGYKRFMPNELVIAARNAGFVVDITTVFDGKAYCLVCRREG